MMNDLAITLIQPDLHWEAIEANLATLEEMIWQKEGHSDLIVLPEMFSTGFSMNPEKLAEPPGGKTFKWMQMMAKQHKVAITGSYIIKEKKEFFNRLYFVYPDGSASHYDKRHLFSLADEHLNYTKGNDRLIVEYKGWKIHPLICYDLRFPVWSRTQSISTDLFEYDLLIYVANWPEARIHAWDTLLQARAIENLSYCVGVNRVGIDGFQKNYPGHSACYNFKGETVGFTKEESVTTLTISSEAIQKFRNKYNFQADADSFRISE